MALKLLISPLTRGAFFAEWIDVAHAEVENCVSAVARVDEGPQMTFLEVDLPVDAAPQLARLASVQGIFEDLGESLRVVPTDPPFALPDALVWGAKYRGKTNELLTQLAMNLALAACDGPVQRVLDPMAGQGTTLFWALRYGLHAHGIEQEPTAREHLQRHVKRQAKLHRLKHRTDKGSVGPKQRDGAGRYVEFTFGDVALRHVTGDSRRAPDLVGRGRFDLLVTDVPYGVQHVPRGGTRDPTAMLEQCAPAWAACLRPGGAAAISYNRLLPARERLVPLFTAHGLEVLPTEVPHRMSESILRDILLLRKPTS